MFINLMVEYLNTLRNIRTDTLKENVLFLIKEWQLALTSKRKQKFLRDANCVEKRVIIMLTAPIWPVMICLYVAISAAKNTTSTVVRSAGINAKIK